MRRILLAAAGMLTVTAPATAFFEPFSRHSDLNGDGKPERVHTLKIQGPGGGTDDLSAQTAVAVEGACGQVRITAPQDALGFLKLPEADTRPGHEVLADLRSGASGRAGSVDLVAWRPGPNGCPQPRRLFHHSSDERVPPPKGAD